MRKYRALLLLAYLASACGNQASKSQSSESAPKEPTRSTEAQDNSFAKHGTGGLTLAPLSELPDAHAVAVKLQGAKYDSSHSYAYDPGKAIEVNSLPPGNYKCTITVSNSSGQSLFAGSSDITIEQSKVEDRQVILEPVDSPTSTPLTVSVNIKGG